MSKSINTDVKCICGRDRTVDEDVYDGNIDVDEDLTKRKNVMIISLLSVTFVIVLLIGGFIAGFFIYNYDGDGDGVRDSEDAFPDDPAASSDSDGDGRPDEWNAGKGQSDSTTGLELDLFPDDGAASSDSDGDGCPDEWNAGKGQSDSITGLELDLFPNDPDQSTFDFVTISSGSFMMGSTTGDSFAEPVHHVNIGYGFQMGKFEVTQAQWKAVMGTTPWSGEEYVQQGDNNPAVNISWYDCQDLVSALNDRDPDHIYRLPSESEWEYCCRAGSTTDFCFGDDVGDLGDYAWYYDNAWNVGEMYPHEVGTKLPNDWGLHDMHGNVYEWCQDLCHPGYNGAPNDGSAREDPGQVQRVIRGGCFSTKAIKGHLSSSSASNLLSAERNHDFPDRSQCYIGLRLVRVQV